MTGSARLTVAILALSSAALAAQSKLDWDDLYREAITHVERRQWQPAEEKLLQAIKLNPESGRGLIRRGMFQGRDDYFPEFFLGVVYANTNRPKLALDQFQRARQRGVNPKESRFRQIDDFEKAATQMLAAELAKAKAPVDGRPQQFKTLMDQAQKALGDGRLDEAQNLVGQARALNVDNAAADGLSANISRRRATNRLMTELKGNLSLAELRRLLTEYEKEGANLDELRRRIAAAEATEARATGERNGMIEFYSGNYQKALALISEAEKIAPLTARGNFYRACILASLATRGKATNQAMLRDARRYYALAAKEADTFKNDLRYISPRLLQLLQG